MSVSGIITFTLSMVLGYFFFLYLSHPEKQKKRVPKVGVWNIEFLPNFRVHIGSKTYHFHHWLVLALIILLPFILSDKFSYPMIFKGVIVGGILQGLRYPDRFRFRHPRVPKFADWEKILLTLNPSMNKQNKREKKSAKQRKKKK